MGSIQPPGPEAAWEAGLVRVLCVLVAVGSTRGCGCQRCGPKERPVLVCMSGCHMGDSYGARVVTKAQELECTFQAKVARETELGVPSLRASHASSTPGSKTPEISPFL